jgi:hypothetical protein
MRKYGCLGQKWLRDKLRDVFSEEKNNKQNINKEQPEMLGHDKYLSRKPVLFFLFFSCFSLFFVALRLFLKICVKKKWKMKK